MSHLLAHSVKDANGDLEMSIALGHYVTAECGKRWVPTLAGDEVADIPECPACHPKMPERKKKDSAVATGRNAKSDKRPSYVYRHYDASDRLIYVGCTVNPPARFATHRATSWWADQIASTRLTVFPNREYALLKEREAIGEEQPRWNVKGRWPYRSNWGEGDYLDYLTAIRQGAAVIGTYSAKHIAEVQAELDSLRLGKKVPA